MAEVQQQWKKEAKKVQPILQQLSRKVARGSTQAPGTGAVSQLDAEVLDKELSEILRSQFMRIFAFFKVRVRRNSMVPCLAPPLLPLFPIVSAQFLLQIQI